MKRIGFGIVLLVLLCGVVPAQVSVEVTLDQEQFLPGEDLPVAVRVTNRTGRTLRLGAPNDWLTLSIEVQDDNSRVVSRNGEVPMAGEFNLETGKVAIKRANLAPYFELNTQGKYNITATVRVPGLQDEITSPPKSFYIADGARLWEREFGVPNPSGGPNEVRKYVLQQSGQIKGKLRLFMRVTDSHGARTLKLVQVGTLLSFSRPNPQLDRDSNLHLLYQSGPTSYSYMVFNPDGDLLIRQFHEINFTSRPRLTSDDEGNIRVTGGVRRETNKDLPRKMEPPSTPSTNAVAAPADETTAPKP